LGRIAPHLAQPLAFIFPGRKRTEWPRWKLAVGVKVYDVLCGMRNFGRSSFLSRRQILGLLPGLSQQDLTGGVRYFDALTNDARLVIDTLRSAARYGAAVFNYVRLAEANREADAWSCELLDMRTNRTQRVQARTVVNATGPWSDRLPHSKTSLRLTKGVHLVISRDRLPVPDAVVMAEGSRILFAIPWGERVILGTTDTDYDGPLESPICDVSDAQYVIDVVNDSFPQAGIRPDDIISTWAGLRPLVANPHGKPSDISRRHEVAMNGPAWWDITGGKLTTYRLMAEEAVTAIARHLGRTAASCRTADLPLLEANELTTGSGILPPPVSSDLVEHYCRREWVRCVDDVMIRRTSWHYYHRDRLEIAARVADWMAGELRWDVQETEAQLSRYRERFGSPLGADGAVSADANKLRGNAPDSKQPIP
jgi:glycerol-3-phosphate dehydrogenase